jgi:hypothetical protein
MKRRARARQRERARRRAIAGGVLRGSTGWVPRCSTIILTARGRRRKRAVRDNTLGTEMARDSRPPPF